MFRHPAPASFILFALAAGAALAWPADARAGTFFEFNDSCHADYLGVSCDGTMDWAVSEDAAGVVTFTATRTGSQDLFHLPGTIIDARSGRTWSLLSGATRIVITMGSGSDSLIAFQGTPIAIPLEVNGGGGADYLEGSSTGDILRGKGGNDVLLGNGGDDVLNGGRGSDIIDAMAGADTLYGGADADELYGGEGDDRVYGFFGASAGADTDVLWGEEGADTLYGTGTLIGGDGADTITGGDGDDVIYGNAAGAWDGQVDTCDGGAGSNEVDCDPCGSGYQDNDDDGVCSAACIGPSGCAVDALCDDESGTAECTCWSALDCMGSTASAKIFVDDDRLSANEQTGLSWDAAFGTITEGLSAAEASEASVTFVMVKEGSYSATNEGGTLVLPSGVRLVGGWSQALTGTSVDRDERSPSLYPSVIDAENAHRAVEGAPAAWLDGFTVQNGEDGNSGGGVLLVDDDGFQLVDSIIQNNQAIASNNTDGGGLSCSSSTGVAIRGSIFAGNRVANSSRNDGIFARGGGISLTNSSVELVDSVISGNSAFGGTGDTRGEGQGGGIRARNSHLVARSLQVYGNSAAAADDDSWHAGGAKGGGLYVAGGSAALSDLTVDGNTVSGGNGGDGDDGTCSCVGISCYRYWAPGAGGDGGNAFGGGVYLEDVAASMERATITNNTATEGQGGVRGEAFPCNNSDIPFGSDGTAAGGAVYLSSDASLSASELVTSGNDPEDY